MINLKLAEYDLKTGKFVRFLEQEDFEYFAPEYEDFKLPTETTDWLFDFKDKKFLLGKDFVGFRYNVAYEGERLEVFKKDEKDPLNRFDGLFNGRTYGKGRFVLIINNQDNINKNIEYDGYEDVFIYTLGTDIETNFIEPENLHENPELYEKINK